MISMAKLISYIFSPVVVAPGALAILVVQAGINGSNRMLIWLTAFFFASLVPLITLLILRAKKKITDLDVSLREQRFTPLLISLVSYAIAYVFLETMQANNLTRGLVFCSITNLLIMMLITRYWKVSFHAAGLTGPLAALWTLWNAGAWPMMTLTALVGTSRVMLKAHTPAQVIVGSLLGFFLTFIQLKLFFI